jgi:hypothetical protein
MAREKPPAQEQWKTGEKTGAQSNKNSQKYRRMPMSGCDAGRQATAPRAEPLSGGRPYWLNLRINPGAQLPD